MEETARKQKGGCGATTSKDTSASSDLSEEWMLFVVELENAFVSLFTVCALYHQRDIDTSLGVVRTAVERLSNILIDNSAIWLLSRIYSDVMVRRSAS